MNAPKYESVPVVTHTEDTIRNGNTINNISKLEMERNLHNLVISKINNFFYGYTVSIVPIITKIHEILYTSNDLQISFLSSSIFVGFLIGLIIFGLIGDRFGRATGINICMIINLIGIIGSTFAFSLFSVSVTTVFIFFRILAGIGSGGMLPLTMVISHESTDHSNNTNNTIGALLGLLQSCGWLIGPILLYILLSIFQSLYAYEIIWRISLGITAIAPLYTLYSHVYETRVFSEAVENTLPEERSLCKRIFQWKYIYLLIGTGGSYMFYDFISYGTSIAAPSIFESILQLGNSPKDAALTTIIAGTLGCLGQFLSYKFLNYFSIFSIQLQGFIMNTILFFITAQSIQQKSSSYLTAFFFYMSFFFNTYGPGTACVLLPSVTYPTNVKTTYYALSAGLGKLGAILGSGTSLYIIKTKGIEGLMTTCYYICILASILTVLFVKHSH